jgi:hypothetical protein
MITIKGKVNPAIATINGITYILPYWIEVPESTTLSDIEWISPKTKPIIRPKEEFREVPSSRGNKTYEVAVRSDGRKKCTCSGFMYRRHCRHTDELLSEMGWK